MLEILYMYILGHNVDFGHMQAVDLIRNDNLIAQQIGLFGVELLLPDYTDMLRLCIGSLLWSIKSRNEIQQCLALTCVANISCHEFSESMIHHVKEVLLSQFCIFCISCFSLSYYTHISIVMIVII